MQPNDEKTAELCLVKQKAKKRSKLLNACFSVVKLLVIWLPLIDKCWSKIASWLDE